MNNMLMKDTKYQGKSQFELCLYYNVILFSVGISWGDGWSGRVFCKIQKLVSKVVYIDALHHNLS